MDLQKANTAYPLYLLNGSSLAAAVTEKPPVSAFDITCRSQFPSTSLCQQAKSQGRAVSVLLTFVRAGCPTATEIKGQNAH